MEELSIDAQGIDDRAMAIFRWTSAALLLAGAVAWVGLTVRWPILWDTQVMHYVNFLMDHGREPYRDITDMNMPGAYLVEGWAMHLFGGSDLAWRIYDFSLMALLTAAMMVIARRNDWFAGLFAGVLFALMHGLEGPLNATQRDLVMTVVLVVAYVFLFEAIRRSLPMLLAGFGLCAGIAAAIKPTVGPFALLLLAFAVLVQRRRGAAWVRYAAWGLVGLAAAGAIVIGFLLEHHALGAFLYVLRRVIPQYAGLDPAPLRLMLRNAIPVPVLLMMLPAAWLTWRHHSWREWETVALWAGAVAGFLSYYAQRKGYPYHRYMTVAFLLLWIALELVRGLRERGFTQRVCMTVIALCILFADVRYTRGMYAIERNDKYAQFSEYLEKDLATLGPDHLQGQVECMDMVFGCLNALYHERIVQFTGATGDMMYFQSSAWPLTQHYRRQFARELQQRSEPEVLVISNGWFAHRNSFDKVAAWPEFAAMLRRDYVLVRGRSFFGNGLPPSDPATDRSGAPGYEIFVRRGTEMEERAAALR